MWAKREAVTNLVVLGDEQDNKKKAGGLLIGCPRDRMYPDKMNFELVQQDGESIILSGSASLGRQLNEHDIGKFVKCEFTGWGRSANGKFKVIEVNIWEGDPNDAMKAWPRFAEFNGAKTNGKPPVAVAAAPVKEDDFADFASAAPVDDDLPF